jgi:serralysin
MLAGRRRMIIVLAAVACVMCSSCSSGSSGSKAKPRVETRSTSGAASHAVPPPAAGGANGADSRSARAKPPTLFVGPSGGGDGSSWAEAASIARLPKLLATARPGAVVALRADAGAYRLTSPLPLSATGTAGRPVIIEGLDRDGSPAAAHIVGTRVTPYRAGGFPGAEAFRIAGGSAHLMFDDIAFSSVGDPFRLLGSTRDITISDVQATNVRRFLLTLSDAGSASVTGLTVSHVTIRGFSKDAFKIGYDSSDVVLRDVLGDSEHQDGDHFADGVHLVDTTHHVLLQHVTMRDMRDTTSSYWNGDGFTTEQGVRDVVFDHTVAADNTDAGYDLKSTANTLRFAVATGNKRNFRIWNEAVMTHCIASDPHIYGGTGRQTQLWLNNAAHVRATASTFTDASPATLVFDLDPDATLHVGTSRIDHGAGSQLSHVDAGANLSLTDDHTS